jgi:ribosomal protein L20
VTVIAKRVFRRLWIARINAHTSVWRLLQPVLNGLKERYREIDRKVLSDIAIP